MEIRRNYPLSYYLFGGNFSSELGGEDLWIGRSGYNVA